MRKLKLFSLALMALLTTSAWATMTSLYDGTADVTVGFRNAEYASSNWSGNAKETQQTYKKGDANPTLKAMSIAAAIGFQQASSSGQYGLKLGNGGSEGGALCFYVSAKCEFRIVASTNGNGQTIYLYKDASEYSLTKSNYATASTEINSVEYPSKSTQKAMTGVLESGYYRIASGANKIWIDTIRLTEYVPVTNISVAPSSATIMVGRRVQLKESITPANASLKNVTWSVKSGSTYASVNSKTGVVTGLAEGDAVITATANDGSGVTKDVTISVIAMDCDTYVGELFKMEVLKVCTCTIASGKTYDLADGDNYSVYGGSICISNKAGSTKYPMSKLQSDKIQWNVSSGEWGFVVTLNDCVFKKGDTIKVISTEANELYLNDGSAKGTTSDTTTSSLKYVVKTGDAFIGKNKVAVWKGGSNTYLRAIVISRPEPTYTVTYNGNGNDSGDVPTDANAYTSGSEVTVKDNTGSLAKTGHTFSGWNNKADTTGANFAVGAKFNITKDTTLYAKWRPNTYTVTLNKDGGTINAGNVTSYTYGVGATLPTDVTKDNYDFLGWFDNDGLTGDAVTEIADDATGNKEFWAKWILQCDATIPGDISKGTATGGTGEITLTADGAAADGDTWYWQSSEGGTDKVNKGATLDVDEAGTYYIRSYNTDDNCWSAAKYVTVSGEDLLTAISPSLSYDNYVIINNTLSPTLSGNDGSGTVTYTLNNVTPAGCMTIVEATGVITAVAEGTATVTATIAANGNYKGNSAISGTITSIVNPVGTHTMTWTMNVGKTTYSSLVDEASASSIYLTANSSLNVGSASSVNTGGQGQSDRTIKVTGDNDKNVRDDNSYIEFPFAITTGYTFTPTAASVKIANITTIKKYDLVIFNADGSESVARATFTSTKTDGSVEDISWNSISGLTLTGSGKMRVYAYYDGTADGAADGHRFGTPITITGTVSKIHAITIDNTVENGFVGASAATAIAGDEITLNNTADSGWKLRAYDVYKTDDAETKVSVTSGKFIMPDYPVTVSGVFAQLYNVTCATGLEHGSISADKAQAISGETVTLTATPVSGYQLDAIKVIETGSDPENDVTDDVLEGTTLTMPAFAVTVSATFTVATGINDVENEIKAVKRIVNGMLVIEKNGKFYNVLGGRVK